MVGMFQRSMSSFRVAFFFGIIFLICSGILGTGSISNVGVAHAMVTAHHWSEAASCPATANPGKQSLLVVLLDRSGSLVAGKYATDPDGYSTSVTKALADLWPGTMIVIPFGDPLLDAPNTTVPVLPTYKAVLTDSTQRETLKENIQAYPIKGGTPLAPAMRKALSQPELQNPAPGSRIMIITDGGPTPTTSFPKESGNQQRREIETTLIGQFSQHCLPVSAFGLQTDTNADKLLNEITNGTGGVYTKVQSPGELALQVITFYAKWQGLSFKQESKDLTDNTYHVELSQLAERADIVTFHRSGYTPTVAGPGGEPIESIPNTDNHYEIASIESKQIAPGTYKVNMGSDPEAQVYALVNSRLQVGINAPTQTTLIYVGQTLKIDASLLNGPKDRFTPQTQAALNAEVTFTANGQQPVTDKIPLVQQLNGDKDTFIGEYILPPGQLGQIRIVVHASYDNTDRDSKSVMVQLAPLPCNKGFVQCFLEEHQTEIIIATPLFFVLLLLLLGFFFWLQQPSPSGWLSNDRFAIQIDNKTRRLSRRLFSKSVVSSNELQFHPQARGASFKFNTAIFDLIFKRGGAVYLRPAINDRSRISTNRQTPNTKEKEKLLTNGSTIEIDRKEVATYSISRPRGYDPQGKKI